MTRVQRALSSNATAASDSGIRISDRVLVYREKSKQWEGPYSVENAHDTVVIINIDGHQRQYSIDKVKLFHEHTPRDDDDDNTNTEGETSAQPNDEHTDPHVKLDPLHDNPEGARDDNINDVVTTGTLL